MIPELTAKERTKIALKRVLSLGFNLLGGFHLARRLTRPGITIITYHRIVADDHEGVCPYISVRESDFRRQVQFFKKYYAVISLDEAVDLVRRDEVHRHYLVITFDDGYRDNFSLGLNIFEREGIRPTVFVTTGCVDRLEPLWPDKVRQLLYGAKLVQPVMLADILMRVESDISSRISAVKAVIAHLKKMDMVAREKYLQELRLLLGDVVSSERLMLNWDEIGLLSRSGVTIAAHTINHPVLANVAEDVAATEISGSRARLEQHIGRPVKLFAYPNGTVADFTETTIAQLKDAGYEAAVTTIRGVNRSGEDLFRLRRSGVYLTDSLSEIKFKLALESLLPA